MTRPAAAALLLVLTTSACTRTGEVVVVLDSTMRGEGVEVIAFPSNDDEATTTAQSSPVARSAPDSPSRALEDSATMLAERFTAMRDSLNRDVELLADMDRRTKAYAVRYAEIRRRTLAAEQVRARRDSVRGRAEKLGVRFADGSAPGTVGAQPPSRAVRTVESIPGLQRHDVGDSTIALELAPGRWSVGVTRGGRLLVPPTSVLVNRGSTDTLRFPSAVSPANGAR